MNNTRTIETVLEVRELRVSYDGRRVLSVDNLAVLPGEILALLGPNGAGKSTLLRILALLEAPTSGTVWFNSKPVRYDSGSLLALRRRMATVFQSPLLCNTTVFGNIALGLSFRGRAAAETAAHVRKWAETFGIAHLLDHPAASLSGGEAQRVSLARAFVLEPEVLFLDEPFAALDPPTRDTLLKDLQTVLRRSRITTLFVTHDRSEALCFGDRVAVMIEGRLAQVGSPEQLFSSPNSEQVARLVGAENIFRGSVLEQRDGIGVVALEVGKIQVASEAEQGEEVLVCLRPEDIVLLRQDLPLPRSSMRNVLRGRIRRVVPVGPQFQVQVDSGVALTALITKQSLEELGLTVGGEVQAAFKVSAAHVIRKGKRGQATFLALF